MSEAPRLWKLSPFHRQTIYGKLRVAFISRNTALLTFLRKKPCWTKYDFDMFTTVHGHVLSFHDIILLDNGLPPFTVESYILRSHAKKAYHLSNGDYEVAPDPESSPIAIETSSSENQDTTSASNSRRFSDLAELYEKRGFPAYAEVTEHLITEANRQLEKWRSHLLNEGGFSVIKVIDPTTNHYLAKRCVLLPSTALVDWRYNFNHITKRWLDFSLIQFPRHILQELQQNKNKEMDKMFYFKTVGVQNSERKRFVDVPLWKMEVMLKKWRTERALQQWGAEYQHSETA